MATELSRDRRSVNGAPSSRALELLVAKLHSLSDVSSICRDPKSSTPPLQRRQDEGSDQGSIDLSLGLQRLQSDCDRVKRWLARLKHVACMRDRGGGEGKGGATEKKRRPGCMFQIQEAQYRKPGGEATTMVNV